MDLGSNPGEATLVRPIPASPGGTADQGQTNKWRPNTPLPLSVTLQKSLHVSPSSSPSHYLLPAPFSNLQIFFPFSLSSPLFPSFSLTATTYSLSRVPSRRHSQLDFEVVRRVNVKWNKINKKTLSGGLHIFIYITYLIIVNCQKKIIN